MNSSDKNRFLLTSLFLFLCSVLINYIVRTNQSLHYGKDGGLASLALFQCMAGYFYFIFLRRGVLSYFGLGFFIAFGALLFDMFFLGFIDWKNSNYLDFMLLHQFLSNVFTVVAGYIFFVLTKNH